jgi:hypothetical protein
MKACPLIEKLENLRHRIVFDTEKPLWSLLSFLFLLAAATDS